jgi:hypothetical protein
MSYSAVILADSLSPQGVRLVTAELTHPRFILAEINTHKMLSKNSASSRAIPTEKLIAAVKARPFMPETFNKRVKGMGYGDELGSHARDRARREWLAAADSAVDHAHVLADLDVDKSRVNRLLEPFLWHTTLISGTDWANFFGLRQPDNDDPVPQQDFPAQPEFQIIARMLRDEMRGSTPASLDYEDWHLPLVTDEDRRTYPATTTDEWKLISAGRCARVSYDRHHDGGDPAADIERAQKLMESGHLSPFEHVARPAEEDDLGYADSEPALEYFANFRGWVQMRREIPKESAFHGDVA